MCINNLIKQKYNNNETNKKRFSNENVGELKYMGKMTPTTTTAKFIEIFKRKTLKPSKRHNTEDL